MNIRQLISDVIAPFQKRSTTVRKHGRTSNYRRSGQLVIEAFETRDLMAADLPGIGERPGVFASQDNRPVIVGPPSAGSGNGVGGNGATFDRPTQGNDGHLLLADAPVQIRLNNNMDTFTETIVPEVVRDLVGGGLNFDDHVLLRGSIEDI